MATTKEHYGLSEYLEKQPEFWLNEVFRVLSLQARSWSWSLIMNSHLERGVINHLTKRREKSPLKGLEMKRIKFRLWER